MRTALILSSLSLAFGLALAGAARAQPTPAPGPAAGAPGAAPSVYRRSGIADWTKAPPPSAERRFTPPVPKRLRLRNGIAVLVVESRALPIASAVLVVPGAGAASDPVGKSGLAAYTADLLDEGAAGMSAIALAEETARLGATISLGVEADAAYVTVSTLARTLDQTLALTTKLVTQPALDPGEAARAKGDRMTLLKLRADRPREVVGIVLNSALYGAASPYGRSEIGTREELEATSLADAASFYKERWNPAAMTLVVVGDVDAAALQAKLDLGLGAWRPAGVKAPALPAVTAGKPPARLLVVDRKDAAQSDVRIGMIGLDRRDPRFFAFEVLRTTLGDGFTSRLTQRLREQLGITYGARAAMDWRRRPGPFVIGSAIATPATGQGIREVLKLVDDLARIDVPGDELEKSKQNMIRASPERFDTNASTAATLAELALHGLPDDWYRGYAESVRKVTASEVRAVAGAALPASKLVVALAGDLAKIGADLGQLGLGAPALYDAYGRPLAK